MRAISISGLSLMLLCSAAGAASADGQNTPSGLLAAAKPKKDEAADKAAADKAAADKAAEEKAAADKAAADKAAADKAAADQAAADKAAADKAAADKAAADQAAEAAPAAKKASTDEAAADGEEPPEGCVKEWLCFKPVPDEELHPDLAASKFKTWAVTAMLGPLFSQWVMADENKVALTDADLMALLKATIIPPLILSLFYLPGIFCPPALYVGMIVMGIVWMVHFLWVAPMTNLHIINRAVTRNKAKKAASKEAAKSSTMVAEAPVVEPLDG